MAPLRTHPRDRPRGQGYEHEKRFFKTTFGTTLVIIVIYVIIILVIL